MAYRVILVPIMGDPAEQHALDLTRTLTDMIRSHIVGIHVRQPVDIAMAGGMVGPAYMTLSVIEALEDSDDVQDVFANGDIPDDVLAELDAED